jgi:transposase-like protein
MSKMFRHAQTIQDWQDLCWSQRYLCCGCQCRYIPEKKQRGYEPALRKRAVQLYVDGMNLRRIGRQLGVHHRTVSDWVKAHAENLPEAPLPAEVKTAGLDELFTFIGNKKQNLPDDDCRPCTRCILEWKLVWERTKESIQALVDEAPKAKFYFSDGFEAYSLLW